ncbi:hypothetical protein DITRI_Ditri08aG0131700 [Diplodiscus trichospermus]
MVDHRATNWRSLFSAVADQTLKYFPINLVNGKALIAPPQEIFEEGAVDIRPAGTNLFIVQFPNSEMRDKLSNIPLELFTQKGISYIASALGNPLYIDKFTASQQRLTFAKICVEINAKMEIPKMIDVVLQDGTIGQIYVDIPWIPARCSNCGEDRIPITPRQARAASASVADLMKSLKLKKKGPADKGKNNANTSSEGNFLPPSS